MSRGRSDVEFLMNVHFYEGAYLYLLHRRFLYCRIWLRLTTGGKENGRLRIHPGFNQGAEY